VIGTIDFGGKGECCDGFWIMWWTCSGVTIRSNDLDIGFVQQRFQFPHNMPKAQHYTSQDP
jgi:uncharacterized protein (DUF779 family)